MNRRGNCSCGHDNPSGCWRGGVRHSGLGGVRISEAQKLRAAIAELVATLSGDLVEEDDDAPAAALPVGRILVHDHNTSTIRFSLINPFTSTQVIPKSCTLGLAQYIVQPHVYTGIP